MLVQTLIVAAVQALQGGSTLTEDSVIATVKHFPGSGAQTDGVDGTPLTIQEDSIDLHLAGFKAAIEAGVAAVMPYGYSTVPYLGGDAVENSADQSAAVMTDLLRGELGYAGIIQTDWGLNFVGRCQRRRGHPGRRGRAFHAVSWWKAWTRSSSDRRLPPDSGGEIPAGHL